MAAKAKKKTGARTQLKGIRKCTHCFIYWHFI